jgi:hypothetical protein
MISKETLLKRASENGYKPEILEKVRLFNQLCHSIELANNSVREVDV